MPWKGAVGGGIASPAGSPGTQPELQVSVGSSTEWASQGGNRVNNSNEAECELLLWWAGGVPAVSLTGGSS